MPNKHIPNYYITIPLLIIIATTTTIIIIVITISSLLLLTNIQSEILQTCLPKY